MRRTKLGLLILLAAFVPLLAQPAYMSLPVPGSTTSDPLQDIVFRFYVPGDVNPATIVLYVDGVRYTTADIELTWASPNLYFNTVVPFTEGEVVCSLANALNWSGTPIAGLPVVARFIVDLSGPYVVYHGLIGSSVPLPTTVQNSRQGGEWYVYDDYSDLDPLSIVIRVNGIDYTFGTAGLIWENDVPFDREGEIIYCDRIAFDPIVAGVEWTAMDTVTMELRRINDSPDYGFPHALTPGPLNKFFFFVDYYGPVATRVSPVIPRFDGIYRTSCGDMRFQFDIYDDNGIDLTSLRVRVRGAVHGYSSSYFTVETLQIDTLFHLYVPDTIFRVWAVNATYNWESRCNILATYTRTGLTTWWVVIHTPLVPAQVIGTADYMSRAAAIDAAFVQAALGRDALIERIVPNWPSYMTFIQKVGCSEGETVYVVSTDEPMPGAYIYDTLVTGRAALRATADLYYPGMGWGIEPVFGRISHPFFAAAVELVPTTVRLTYTPIPPIYQGEIFNMELISCADVFGNPLEESDVAWLVTSDRTAPSVVEYYPPHNTITTNPLEPIWIKFRDPYGPINPHSIKMRIQTTSGDLIVLDSLPLPPWPAWWIWDPSTNIFRFDPVAFGISWEQGETITVTFLDVADSSHFCPPNRYSHFHPFLSWSFFMVDGPLLVEYFPHNASFVSCPTQQIGFMLYDMDGIDQSSVVLAVEGRLYDLNSPDTSIVCHWLHIGPTDSILIRCDTTIYNPLQYYGAGVFRFTPPRDMAVDGRQIECAIVQAEDMLGNPMWYIGDYAWYYTYDFTGPYFFDPQPAPGSYAPGSNVVISMAIRDSVSGHIAPEWLYYSIGGSTYGPSSHPDYCWWDGDRFYLDFGRAGISFPDGHVFNICLSSVYDAPDYMCSETPNRAAGLPYCWSFRIDNRPPTYTLLSPLPGRISACPTQEIKILLQDNLGIDPTSPVMVVEGVIYTMASPRLGLVGDTLIFTPSTPWYDGQVVDFSLASVADRAGNALTGSPLISNFIVDRAHPRVVETTPEDGEIVGAGLHGVEIVLDDISGITENTAYMAIDVTYDGTTDEYEFFYGDGLFDFGTLGRYYTVSLDFAAAGIYIPPRGADVDVRFKIQDSPNYSCFVGGLVGNELDYSFSFSVTPGWRLPLMLIPTVLVYDSLGTPIYADGDTGILTMGAAYGATDGYDPDIDVLAPPFPPEVGGLTIIPPSFLLDGLRLITDLKSLASMAPVWMIWTGTTRGTIEWDPAALPDYGSFVISGGSGVFDMRSTNRYSYGPAEAVYINFTPEIITLQVGWNLVSVPVTPTNPNPSAVFRVPASYVFWYNPYSMSFQFPAAIYPGYAYFVLYIPGEGDPDIISFTVDGDPIYQYEVTLPEGWNTIGSVYDFGGVRVTDVAHVHTLPSGGIWGTGVYGYDPYAEAYYFSPYIVAGKGYWAYIDLPAPYSTCVLTVEASWLKAIPYVDPLTTEDIAHLDVEGTKLELAIQEGATNRPDEGIDRLMPPAMVNQTNVAYLACGNMQLSRDVRKDAEWTLVLTRNARITTDRPLIIDGENYEGTFSLPAGSHKVTFGKAVKLPTASALYQNNPNPFNATTDIEFDLPEKATVSLEVYNMLGQRIRTLVSGEVEAGHHSVSWNGNDNGGNAVISGIYFYRLTVGDETITRKMVLLK